MKKYYWYTFFYMNFDITSKRRFEPGEGVTDKHPFEIANDYDPEYCFRLNSYREITEEEYKLHPDHE